MLFPPDVKSQWCLDASPTVPCDPASWSVKVAIGVYEVKVTMGDAEFAAQYDLAINGKKLFGDKEPRERILKKK